MTGTPRRRTQKAARRATARAFLVGNTMPQPFAANMNVASQKSGPKINKVDAPAWRGIG
jgi:hypothetical protein